MDAIGTDISVLRDRLVGTIVQDKGFVSTSLNAGYVEDFGGVVFHIRVPKGKQRAFGFYDSAGPDTWEWEMLLDRNTQFRVVNMTADAKKGQLILDMELIP